MIERILAVTRLVAVSIAALLLLALPALAGAATATDEGPTVGLRSVAAGLAVPVAIAEPDDGTGRLFVVDQSGTIWVVENGSTAVFLDLTDRIVDIDPEYDERGVLGLAFHPGYADNGRFFVYYSAPLHDDAPDNWDHTSHISEFAVSADDADRADPDSERVVLAVDQPFGNHNAGQMVFGHDGYLYIALGDGGDGGDTDPEGDDRGRPDIGHGQDVTTILGSILRIDVDDGDPYAVPSDNPFVDDDGIDEAYAYGFRNPYGLSIDHETGDIYAADAGQARYEEVSRLEHGGNFGWRIKEGTHCFDPDNFLQPPAECPDTGERGDPLIDPVIEYERGPESGSVITPGVLYRGSMIPELEGRFVFADYATIRFIPTGIVYVATPTDEGLWPMQEVVLDVDDFARFVLGVGQDLDGELYLLTSEAGGPAGTSGEVFALRPVDAPVEVDWMAWWPVVAVVVVAAVGGVVVWRMRRTPEEAGPA